MPATSRKPRARGAMSALLQKRIAEFDIKPWPGQAMFERVVVFQVPDEELAGEKVSKDSLLFKPVMTQQSDEYRSPRGIIVSAGLQALKIMCDHGMQIGDIVWLAPHLPYRFVIGKTKAGLDITVFFLNVGDIVLDEDVLTRVADGKLDCYLDPDHGNRANPSKHGDDI